MVQRLFGFPLKMRFEILVEGQSELTALSILMNDIVGEYGEPHTWKIHKHQGIGGIPENPASLPNRNDRTLLHNLPAKLRAYGNEEDESLVVVVLVDLDDRQSCIDFKNQLLALLNYCDKKPNVLFRIAIEELEAWYLGDAEALRKAYPDARHEKLADYIQDSQEGTWEMLAEIVHPGGLSELLAKGKRSPLVREEKVKWAKTITPHMDVEQNQSPSFSCFRDGLRRASVWPIIATNKS